MDKLWAPWRRKYVARTVKEKEDCVFCKNKIGVKLHPHHIKQLALFPELAFRIDNGITYCAEFYLKSGLHNNIQEKLKQRVN